MNRPLQSTTIQIFQNTHIENIPNTLCFQYPRQPKQTFQVLSQYKLDGAILPLHHENKVLKEHE